MRANFPWEPLYTQREKRPPAMKLDVRTHSNGGGATLPLFARNSKCTLEDRCMYSFGRSRLLNVFSTHASSANDYVPRELDEGITTLTETWKIPHVLVGRFGECTEDTRIHIEAVWNTIRNTQNGVNEIHSEIKCNSLESSVDMEQLLHETREAYEELKEQCDNLGTVLAEYGYHYEEEENNTTDEKFSIHTTESHQHPAIQTDNQTIEFTPDLSWRCKVRSSEPLTPLHNNDSLSHRITTPLHIDVGSTVKTQSCIKNKDYAICTPIRERPQEPIYSKHFYNVLKK